MSGVGGEAIKHGESVSSEIQTSTFQNGKLAEAYA
uniref:Uncharacterized protein n=1 Tax=Tetraselmis sp. GSL018 TaxID=582737 RepID=A0A061SKG4_9CHLO